MGADWMDKMDCLRSLIPEVCFDRVYQACWIYPGGQCQWPGWTEMVQVAWL